MTKLFAPARFGGLNAIKNKKNGLYYTFSPRIIFHDVRMLSRALNDVIDELENGDEE